MALRVSTVTRAAVDSSTPRGSSRVLDFLGVRGARAGDDAYVDGLRASAVMMVVVFHAYGLARTYGPFEIGGFDYEFLVSRTHLGVDLFFILSGFLLARPWFANSDKRPALVPFFRRRLARIVPAYFLSLALVLAVFGWLDWIPSAVLVGWNGLLNIGSHLLFLQAYVPIATSAFNRTNGVWWSLTVEMTWYVVLPLFVLGFLGRRWRISLPLSLAVALIWTWLWSRHLDGVIEFLAGQLDPATLVLTGRDSDASETIRWIVDSSIVGFAWTFALGVMLAKVHVSRRGKGPLISSRTVAVLGLLAAVLLFLGLACWGRNPPEYPVFRQGFALSLAMVVFVVDNGPAGLRRPLEWTPIRFLGIVSYGIFLFHVPFVFLAQHRGWFRSWSAPVALIGLSITVLVLSALVAVLSWVFVERPFLVTASTRASESSWWKRIDPRAVVIGGLAVALTSYFIASRPTAVEKEWNGIAEATASADVAPLFALPPNGSPNAADSGAMTAEQAFKLHVIDDELHMLLAACRSVDAPGSAYSFTDGSSGSPALVRASVFSCATVDDAQRVIAGTRENRQRFGQERETVDAINDVSVVRGLSASDREDRTQIRYRSENAVITIDVTAADALTSTKTATDVWYFANHAYPVSD